MSTSSEKKPTVVDLFCGAGGLSKGFEMAGYEVVLGVEKDPVFMATFKKNHPSATLNGDHTDIRKLTKKTILGKVGKRKIDLVIGGPPCQGFSMAGRRDPKDPRNALFKHYVRLVRALKPSWFVMENVPGLLNAKTADGESVDSIIRGEFKKADYEVEPFILYAANYGVPQKRRRLFYIGTNTGMPITAPTPTHCENPVNTLSGPKLDKWVGVGEKLISEKDISPKYFHSQKMIDGFRERKERNKKNGKGFGWQILEMDKPSYTISARYWKDGADALVKYSEDRIRMLSEKECARIQSFPDDYEFLGNKRQRYTQIGNAVPPLLAKAIAIHLKPKIKKEDKET